jgi:TonB family protein
MNVAQPRPRSWTPHIVLFSLVLHAVVIYYVAVAFNIVPPVDLLPRDPPTIQTVRFDPPPPVIIETPVEKEPRFRPRDPRVPPIQQQIEPLPLTPQPPKVSTAQADVLVVNTPIQEEPVSQSLPQYPRMALERGVEGRVVMSITIMPDGSVRDVRVVDARPRGYFEATAVRSVERWRYRPSSVTRTNVIVHMDFELKDA